MRGRQLLLAAALLAGCTRSHYRVDADRETYPILTERVLAERKFAPAFDVGRTQLDPEPTSRLYDPFNPDHPPRPPDDPAADLFMERPGGLKGYRGWNRDGVTDQLEGPNWEQALGLDAKGTLKLDQDKAVEIAFRNSREFQTSLETIYLSALSLTLNRFEFDCHWFGRTAPTFTHFGSSSFPTETNTVTVNSELGFTQNLAAGGQLLVDFANSFVYEFVGKTGQVQSNLLISLTQPLLRNAGREVRLETLTQAERDVLYAVRDFARFRKQFWANVAVQSGGYLDLLLALQTLRNNQANLQRQEETYRLYNELFRGGRASVVEVDQFFQSLLSARQAVIDSEANLESLKDNFKLRLGLPPRLPVDLDDALLNRFVLTDPTLDKLHDELEAFQRDRLKELGEPPPAADLDHHFAALQELAGRLAGARDQARSDLDRWGRQLDRPAQPGDDREQRDRARETYENLKRQAPEFATDLGKVQQALADHRRAVNDANRMESWEAITGDVKNVLALLDTLIAMQIQARIYLIELPETTVREDEALTYAREHRLDLQNRLGLVTDAWRRVWVAANALWGDVNVVATANLFTDPDHKAPFNFANEASRYTVGLQFEGPLNRLAERNAYRASLITYQRARREWMALADQVEFQIREDLRQLNRLRSGFVISRQQVLSAARQYENARLVLLGPRDRRSANDTTTLNLLQALNALVAARNSLAASYISYEQRRTQLLLDLEALHLDQRGFPTHASEPPHPPAPSPTGGGRGDEARREAAGG